MQQRRSRGTVAVRVDAEWRLADHDALCLAFRARQLGDLGDHRQVGRLMNLVAGAQPGIQMIDNDRHA